MKWRRAGCPSAVELERAFWSDDANLRSHAAGCRRCGPEWEEIAALVAAGRQIQSPPSPHGGREEIRATLLSQKVSPTPARRRAGGWRLVVAPVGAAAAVVLALWMWPSGGQAPTAGSRRTQLLDHGDASYMIASTQPDEIVRLVDGTLTVEVESLAPHERFRVITGDAEILVADTAFDVTARRDRLVAVRVMHGAVEVRAAGGEIRLITSGQTWRAPEPAAESQPVEPPHDAGPATEPAATAAAEPGRAVRPRRARIAAKRALDEVAPELAPPVAAIQVEPDAGPTVVRSAAQQAFDDGWSAIRTGHFAEAAAAFERAASLSVEPPVTEDALFWGAVALARAGQDVPAGRAFATFLEAYPESTRAGEASVMLGWLLFEAGDHGSARRRFRAAARDRSERVRQSAASGLDALGRAAR